MDCGKTTNLKPTSKTTGGGTQLEKFHLQAELMFCGLQRLNVALDPFEMNLRDTALDECEGKPNDQSGFTLE